MVAKKTGSEKFSAMRAGQRLTSLFLAVLMVLGIFAQSGVITADAAGDTTLAIYKGNSEAAVPFHAANMFPGDSIENPYSVEISYVGNLTLHFGVQIHPDSEYEKLAEVLKCRISINGEQVYDGLLKDVPASIDHALSSGKKTTEKVAYDINVYLDTSVGNEYQGKELMCDFTWWVIVPGSSGGSGNSGNAGGSSDTGSLTSPKTGDQIMIWVAVLAVSGAVLAVLFFRKRKEDEHDAE